MKKDSLTENILTGAMVILTAFMLVAAVYMIGTVIIEEMSVSKGSIITRYSNDVQLIFKDGYKVIGQSDGEHFTCITPDDKIVRCSPIDYILPEGE